VIRAFRPPVLLFFLSSWLVAGPARAATIRGTVTDPHGAVVPAAHVLVVAGGAVVAQADADARGTFVVDGLAPGSYELRVVMPGFRAEPVTVRVGGDEARAVPLTLQLAAVAESVVVSAAQVDMPLSLVPDSVTVLTRADLDARQITTLPDALRRVPGLTVAQSGGVGGLTSLFPRGGESDFTLVLVDGVEMNVFGGGFDFSSLPIADIERIEVVRGPESAVYGGGAIGAVVQIVTRHGGPPRYGASVEAGGRATSRLAASTAGTRGAWRWGLSVERLATDGFTGTAPASGERVSNDDYDGRHLAMSGGWTGARHATLDARVRVEATERGFPGPYGSDPADLFAGVDRVSRGEYDTRVYSVAGGFDATPRIRPSADVAFTDVVGRFASPYGTSNSASRRLTARARVDARVNDTFGLTAGVELTRERAGSTYITGETFEPVPVERSVQSVFVEGRADTGARLLVSAGVRLDRIGRDALEADPNPYAPRPAFPADVRTAVSPKVSAAFFLQPPAARTRRWTKLKASAGTGIRPPDALEIAFTDNPALAPERSRSVDAGVEQGLAGGAVLLDATAFYIRYDDLIVSVGRSLADASRYRSDNISNARSRGVELAAAARPAAGVEVTFTYTLLATEVLSVDGLAGQAPPPFSPGDPLVRRPRHQASLEVVLRRGRFSGFARAGGRGRMLDVEPNLGASAGLFEAPGFVTTDLGAAVSLGGGLELFGRVTNLFDRAYEETLGFPAPGRTGVMGLRVAGGR